MTRNHRRLSLLLALSTPLLIWAADVTLPHVFQAGGPIVADEMNANFAALRDAVNSKADRSSVVTSGTRLKRIGFRMSDGTTEDATFLFFSGAGPSHVYFDATDNRHCFTASFLTDSQGKGRCFPFAGYSISTNYFSDPQCAVPITSVARASPFPPTAAITLAGETRTMNDDSLAMKIENPSTIRYFQVGQPFGPVYCSGCISSGCDLVPGPFFYVGAEVDPSTFVEVTPARF